MTDLSKVTNDELTRQLLQNLATTGPFFILVLTSASNSINVQAANQTIQELSVAVPFTKDNNNPLTEVIKTYIESSELNTIYNAPVASVASPAGIQPLEDDDIIKRYKDIYINTVGQFADKSILTKDDGSTPSENTTIRELITDPEYKTILSDYIRNKSGGSRSMKHRRRNRKKNKNTKRRNRK
jgi:hypothetical protein